MNAHLELTTVTLMLLVLTQPVPLHVPATADTLAMVSLVLMTTSAQLVLTTAMTMPLALTLPALSLALVTRVTTATVSVASMTTNVP
jgi:hypothetical protein